MKKLQLERYKLDLISEDKLLAEPMIDELISRVPPNLGLVPKFNERDPDIFFVLPKRLPEVRNWSDAEHTLLALN